MWEKKSIKRRTHLSKHERRLNRVDKESGGKDDTSLSIFRYSLFLFMFYFFPFFCHHCTIWLSSLVSPWVQLAPSYNVHPSFIFMLSEHYYCLTLFFSARFSQRDATFYLRFLFSNSPNLFGYLFIHPSCVLQYMYSLFTTWSYQQLQKENLSLDNFNRSQCSRLNFSFCCITVNRKFDLYESKITFCSCLFIYFFHQSNFHLCWRRKNQSM